MKTSEEVPIRKTTVEWDLFRLTELREMVEGPEKCSTKILNEFCTISERLARELGPLVAKMTKAGLIEIKIYAANGNDHTSPQATRGGLDISSKYFVPPNHGKHTAFAISVSASTLTYNGDRDPEDESN